MKTIFINKPTDEETSVAEFLLSVVSDSYQEGYTEGFKKGYVKGYWIGATIGGIAICYMINSVRKSIKKKKENTTK